MLSDMIAESLPTRAAITAASMDAPVEEIER
jgi:hypothetical protein